MKVSTLKLTSAILANLKRDKANPREMRFEITLARSIAGGWQDNIDPVSGTVNRPVLRYNDTTFSPDKFDAAKLTTLRGAGRLGTLKMALSDNPANSKGLSEVDRAKIGSIVDHGDVEVTIIAGVSDDQALNIANDNDALKRSWSAVHRFTMYEAFRLMGDSQEVASRKVGYANRCMAFSHLEALPTVVRNHWIDAQLDPEKPRITDTNIKEMFDKQGGINAKRTKVLTDDAKVYLDNVISGKVTAKATIMPDSSLAILGKQLDGTPFGNLIQVIRGYTDDGKILSKQARADKIADFVTTHRLAQPDDSGETKGSPPIKTVKHSKVH